MKKKLDKNKIYAFIGQAVVYSAGYVTAVMLFIWACTRTVIYQEEKKLKEKNKPNGFQWFALGFSVASLIVALFK